MINIFLAIVSLVLLSGTSPLHAQETTNLSGSSVIQSESGRTLLGVLNAIQKTLTHEKDVSPVTITIPMAVMQEWQSEAARMRQRQLQNRSDCSTAIRRANRDTLMGTANRCVRNELLLETTLLQKQQEYINALPLSDETVRTNLHDPFLRFRDASTAIVNAIDAGLFQQMDTLRQTTRNLHTQYRQTLNQARALVSLERERTWMLTLARNMRSVQTADPANAALLIPTALCLENASALFQESSVPLPALRTRLAACKILMPTAILPVPITKDPQE